MQIFSICFVDIRKRGFKLWFDAEIYHRRRKALERRAQRNEAQACGIVFRGCAA